MRRVGRVDKVKQSTSGMTWSNKRYVKNFPYFFVLYKLGEGETRVDYVQLLDVLVPVQASSFKS